MIACRPARREDIEHFYPEMGASFRAWVCELDGELAGIVGVALIRPTACMFSKFDEALRPHLKCLSILRCIKKARDAMASCGGPVIAIAEPGEETAPSLLRRLGFEYVDNIDGDEVYQWVRQ